MTDLDPVLVAFVKKEEGFVATASWDEKQWTNGYGTRAHYPRELISRAEAERRLTVELTAACATVDHFCPNAPEGIRRALSDLTFNSGIAWQHAGLGDEVKAGNWDEAKDHLLQYDMAGGRINQGLESRRRSEAAWFPNDQVAGVT
jgi:lysozyme